MMMAVLHYDFDDREHTLFAAFRARTAGRDDVVATQRRLDMGDVLIRPADGSPPHFVVERKRVDDLMASVFDGRLAEQEHRMRQWQSEQADGAAWLVVVVEGPASPATFRRAPDPDARFRYFVKTHLQLVLSGSQPTDARLALRTGDEAETAALLLTLHKTVVSGAVAAPMAVMCGAMPRKSHSDAFLRHLCCTRGMSLGRAARVRERFASVTELGRQYAADPAATAQLVAALIGSPCVADRLWADLGHDAPPPPPRKKRRQRSAVVAASCSPASSTITTGATA